MESLCSFEVFFAIMSEDSYSINEFYEDCYVAAKRAKAYRLKDDEQARACIQAFRHVLRQAYESYGQDMVMKLITSKEFGERSKNEL